MNSIAYMIAWRYITRSTQDSSISTMAFISFLGIFIGSFSLALVTAIMQGFDIETQKKMQGIHAQATIHAYGDSINTDALTPILIKEFPEIAAFSPTSNAHALLQTEESENPTVIVLQAIDPQKEVTVTTMHEKIISNIPLDVIAKNGIIIGNRLAENAYIEIGDTVQILYAENKQRKSRTLSFKTYDAVVKGFIKTGIDDFDTTMVLCSFELLNELFPDIGIQSLHVKLAPYADESKTFTYIKNRFNLGIYSWKELYPAIVSALKLEKYVFFLVLALISLVASMNIISLLFMIISDKMGDIAILKALGAMEKDIKNIFLLLGIIITGSASMLGIVAAMIVSWFLNHYPIIQLPDVYYVTHLPAYMSWYIPCLVLLLSLFMCIIAILLPIKKIHTISIARILRFEG